MTPRENPPPKRSERAPGCPNPAETVVLVLQGGGALGAYQAGAFEGLDAAGYRPGWVAGISIGAINAALICGNPPERRLERLRAFWEEVTSGLSGAPWITHAGPRRAFSQMAAAAAVVTGAPGFFSPRLPAPLEALAGDGPISVYDTSPLARTLGDLVDFDYLNAKGPRLTVGAVGIETGNFAYFDSRSTVIGPEHIMASGALPPGFPPVEIDGQLYWDGGLVSNTPLQYVMEHAGGAPHLIFQVDLFSAHGSVPRNLSEVEEREKEIRFSSRTRLTTDRFVHLQRLRMAAERLAARLPKELQDDPDLKALRAAGPACPVTLVHLIHQTGGFDTSSKDYDFSRLSMTHHWAAGLADLNRTFVHPDWTANRDAAGILSLSVIDAHRKPRARDPSDPA